MKIDRSLALNETAMQLGRAGYSYFNSETNAFEILGDFIIDNLTESELTIVKEKGFWPFVHPDEIKDAKAEWDDALQSNTPFEKTCRINSTKHGETWIRFHAKPTSEGFTCFFIDVTDQKRAQKKLCEAKKQLEKALHEKNYLLGRLSHEIRTPMNAVIGIADALIHHKSDPAIANKLDLIQSSAVNILRILDRTLDETKQDSEIHDLQPETANPRRLVEKLCKLWVDQAHKNNTEISCRIDKAVPQQMIFDKFRYEQCLNNLLSNAVKFTKNGKIDVVLTVIEKGDQARLVLAVKDTGIGMTESQKTQIFEAFKQGDQTISTRYGGTGLGMHITKQLSELMGGNVSVRSKPDQGSLFALWIPIELQSVKTVLETENTEAQTDKALESGVKNERPKKQSSVAKEEKTSTELSSVSLVDTLLDNHVKEVTKYSDLKILVADDNPTNHVVVQSILEDTVGEIYTAVNGQDVLDVLHHQAIDIILMDIHMPVMDGIEATLEIRKANKPWKDVPIIALTADPQYQQKRVCLNIGMNEALAKPVKVSEILKAFDLVIERDMHVGEQQQEYKEAV